ncbi:MAG: thioesterase [Chloroflexota bacterium]|nr:thioesterase [Chloroflexota bacterium]
MLHRYTAETRVRIHDVDAWGTVPAQVLAAYVENAAWEASADAGFTETWYRTLGVAWVIHRLTLLRLGPLEYGDRLTTRTWISSLGRVRSSRDYEMSDPAGTPVLTGRADWVFIDRERRVPKGIDRAIVDTFECGAPTAWLVAPPTADPLPAPGRPFTLTQRVYRYDADSLGHVNNTIYLRWLDEALAAALVAAGLPLAAPGTPGLRLEGTRYVVDYLRSARPGDTLTITSRLTGTSDNGATLEWTQEIRCADAPDVLIRAVSRQRLLGLDVAGLTAAVIAALLAAVG